MENVEEPASEGGRVRPGVLTTAVMAVNTACTGLGGLYLTTQSVVVTAIGAVLAVVLMLVVVPASRVHR